MLCLRSPRAAVRSARTICCRCCCHCRCRTPTADAEQVQCSAVQSSAKQRTVALFVVFSARASEQVQARVRVRVRALVCLAARQRLQLWPLARLSARPFPLSHCVNRESQSDSRRRRLAVEVDLQLTILCSSLLRLFVRSIDRATLVRSTEIHCAIDKRVLANYYYWPPEQHWRRLGSARPTL